MRIIIIGGGSGGLAAATALSQKGYDVQVYEAAPDLQPVGKGIWLPTNAMLVLQRAWVWTRPCWPGASPWRPSRLVTRCPARSCS